MANSGWPLKSIEELKAPTHGAIAIGPFGSRMKSDCYVTTGVEVIRGTNIGDTRAFIGEMVCITPQLADQLGNAIVHADDLVFPHRGSIGLVGIVPRNKTERYALSSSLMKLTCDRKQVEPLFLFYFFRSDVGRHELLKNASTVGTPGIGQPLSSLRSIKVPLPPITEQKAIAAVLGALDDKIELNRRMNATLEAMARALFQSWFVDFNPIRAKLDGRQPTGIDKATAALFPDSFQDSEFGHIPKGWVKTDVGSETDFFTGFAFQSEQFSTTQSNIRLARGDNVKEGFFHWDSKTRYWKEITPDLERYQLQSGDVLIGMDGSKVGKNWVRVRNCDLPCLLVQRVARLRAAQSVGEHFLWLLVSDSRFRFHVEAVKTGTSIPHISGGQIKAYKFVRPPSGDNRLFHRFEELVRPLGEQMDLNIEQSRTLATLRDTLLPKLLNGEVRTSQSIQDEKVKDHK